jgi:hypothetical protein
MKTLEQSLDEAWNDTKRLFGYPPIKKPEFTDNTNTAAIDMSNHKITMSKKFVRKVSSNAAKNNYTLDDSTIMKGLLHHEVNHYMYCPYDLTTLMKIEDQISKVTDDNIHAIANYFMDVVINLDLMKRKKRMEVSEVYRHIDKIHFVDRLMSGIYQDKTRTDFGVNINNSGMKARLDALNKIDYLNKKKWMKSSKKFAELINDLINDQNKNDLLKVDNWDSDSYTDGDIEKALSDVAKEFDIGDFKDAVKRAGIRTSSIPQGVDAVYYDQQSKKYLMHIKPRNVKGKSVENNEHKKYEISDSYGSIDVFNSYGKYMPGLSQVWKPTNQETEGSLSAVPDLVLALDTSGSMIDPTRELSPAVLGAFCAAKLYLENKSRVATYNFSSNIYLTEFSTDKAKIFKNLSMFQRGGTYFDVKSLSDLINSTKTKADLMIVTDMGIENFEETINYLKTIKKANRISILWISPDENIDVSSLKSENFNIYKIQNNNDIPKIMIGDSTR